MTKFEILRAGVMRVLRAEAPQTIGETREFRFVPETQEIHVVGYSTDEVAQLLRLYREHARSMGQIALDFQEQNRLAAR